MSFTPYAGIFEDVLDNPRKKLKKRKKKRARRRALKALVGVPPHLRLKPPKRGKRPKLPKPPRPLRRRRSGKKGPHPTRRTSVTLSGILPANVGIDYYGAAVTNARALMNGIEVEGYYGASLTQATQTTQAWRTKQTKKVAGAVRKVRSGIKKRKAIRKKGRKKRKALRQQMWK